MCAGFCFVGGVCDHRTDHVVLLSQVSALEMGEGQEGRGTEDALPE